MSKSHQEINQEFRITKKIYQEKDTNRLLSEMPTLSHVAHRSDARNIIREKKLKAGLVYDESRLNQSRTCVTWLSPTDFPSFIYGTVRFSFPAKELLRGKSLYWVEWMSYQPKSPRILVIDGPLDGLGLEELNIGNFGGPIYGTAEELYRVDSHNYEFMFASDIPLSLCEKIDIVSHDNPRNYCAKSGRLNSCTETSESRSRMQLTAFILFWIDEIVRKCYTPDEYEIEKFAKNLVDWLFSDSLNHEPNNTLTPELFSLLLLAMSDGHFGVVKNRILKAARLDQVTEVFSKRIKMVLGADQAEAFASRAERRASLLEKQLWLKE